MIKKQGWGPKDGSVWKALDTRTDKKSSVPCDPYGTRNELIPEICPITFILAPWHMSTCMCISTYTHTHTHLKYLRKRYMKQTKDALLTFLE